MDDQERLLDYLRRVTTSLHETRQRLQEAEAGRHEPIAIVSTACRFPGAIRSPEDLWNAVLAGRDVVTEAPAERGWDLADSVTTQGGFLDDALRFDAAFFGISPREALGMDPQQRLLLEVAWEALERGRIDPTSLRGTKTGVFAGVIDEGYATRLRDSTADVDGYVLTGCTTSVASGRVAYVLGLEGPAVSIDTACSSSLVALHMACQSLRLGECDQALAGGALVMSTPSTFLEFSRQGALSADGRCRAFSADAAGFGLSEGVGLVLLERLSDAQRNGHQVLAVIRGSAVNQDGASNGLTAPNGQSQQRVIRAALANAGLSAGEVDVVETHGTGTKLGDPIEGGALLATYGKDRDRPLWLGSVKSNIGHTQATAGVAGVIKMVEALRHGTLPPTLHADTPSPLLDWDSGLSLIAEAMPWPERDEPRRAAVSAFGISGTNAHLILEAAPAEESDVTGPEPEVVSLPLSGRDDAALREQASRLVAHVEANELRLVDLGYSLATTRATQAHRAVVIATSKVEVLSGLKAVARGRAGRTAVRGTAPAVEPGKVVFVFPGQGSQWRGMARELMDGSPVFRAKLQACADALAPHVDWPVIELLRGEVDLPLDRPDVVQPALFAMMISLAELWRANGVEPAAVVGHSQGEIAAACFAGVLSLPEAARLVTLRSKVVMDLSGMGGLVSLAVSEAEARERMAPWGDALDIAVVNSPRSVVVAGASPAIDEFFTSCEADEIRVRRVPADYASHSPQVEVVRDQLLEALTAVHGQPGEIPIYSTVTGDVLDGSEMDASYWYQNLRGAVRFEAATRRLIDDGHYTFIEVSPHPVLATGIEETVESLPASGAIVSGTLRRDDGAPDRFWRSLADAYVRGAEIDWAGQLNGRAIDLPTTPFQGERYWPDECKTAVSDGVADEFWAAVETGELARVTDTLAIGQDVTTQELVAALGDWRRRSGTAAAVASWRYEVSWSPLTQSGIAKLDGTWLIVSDESPQAEAVRGMFVRHGAQAQVVPLASVRDVGVVAGVVSLLTDDLAKTLELLQVTDAPLWCVTQGAVSIGRSDPLTRPVQASIWGLGRVAALEFPQRWGGLIDLPETLDDNALARLAFVLAGTGEDQVAVRGSGVFARRLRRATSGQPAEWRPQGTVLITGGTGALGGHVARYLARNGAEHLVLTSRRGPDAPGATELAEELRSLGAQVSVVACDVADRDALATVVSQFTIRAVVHTAGVPTTVPLAEATPGDLNDAMAGKVSGAWHLHELFRDKPLDAFVMFSSGSGVWGAGGQGPYAAANAALDALVEYRRANGLPATSVAWGLWQGDGMAQGMTGVQLRRRGMAPMAPERAVAALSEAVARDEGCLVVADIQWEPFITGFKSARPSRLFDDIAEATLAADVVPASTGLAAQLREVTPAQQRDLLLDLVTTHAAEVLNLPGKQAVAAGRAFRDLGFDSLTSVELRNRLAAVTGLPLPTTVVFDRPSSEALAVHLQEQLLGTQEVVAVQQVERVDTDDLIAIVGMGCRYPGGVDGPEALWRLVADGVDAMGPFPADRDWQIGDALRGYHPEGGFLYDAGDFDADFFGLSPREAVTMDPQQRLVLETSWEAVERAGLDPKSLRGSRTAVVTGIVSQDYAELLRDASDVDGYRITGGSAAVVSGRVSYLLGLEGPALTVDTACSSSLVAIHLACQALRRGEATLALAGGATVMASPTPFLEFSKQQGLSSDGRCHAFAASADGTGWGEGVGMVLLERLSDAKKNGREILAVVRGSALNQDGASNGMTAPSGPAQQDVIRRALADAGLAARDVDVVEAHGTATTLGDPIEAQALLATYGQDRDVPMWLGSLKSNVGHTQAAAGVGGVIKMVQAMRHEKLPATLHVDEPTPHVDWSAGAVRLLTEPVGWPRGDRPRRAGVSAFGISGTNAHLIIEEGPVANPEVSTDPGATMPVLISGQGGQALRAQAVRLGRHLETHPGLIADVAHALAVTRAQLSDRAVVLADDPAGLQRGVDTVAKGGKAPNVVTGVARDRPKVALLFPGQGSQRIGLGRALHAAFPAYTSAFDTICAHFDRHLDHPLAEVLAGDAELLDQTSYAQAALFAVEVALAELLAHFGVRPDVLLGHSIGELAAARVAGALSLEDSCTLVAARGRLMQAQPTGGAMVAIEASEAELRPALVGHQIALAAVNGPTAVVVSGDETAVLDLAAEWQAMGRRTKRLRVSHAFHSPHMDGMLAEFGRVVASVQWSPAEIPVVSNLTGAPVTADELGSPAYWTRHVREAVRFGDGVRWLAENDVTIAVELGGEGTLTTLVREGDAVSRGPLAEAMATVPALRTPRPEVESFLLALAELHVHGVPVDWPAVMASLGYRPRTTPVPLPTTAFQRKRYWLEARRPRQVATPGFDHPVLEAALPLADGDEWVFTGQLSRQAQPWLADHAVDGTAVVPGIALLELALHAGQHVGSPRVDELTFQSAITLPDEGAVDLQIRIGSTRSVTIHSRSQNNSWVRNATGKLAGAQTLADADLRTWPPVGAEPVAVAEMYARLAGRGYTFGPAFQSVRSAWRRGDEWFTEVHLPAEHQPDAHRFSLHPALLDSAGHPQLESFADTARDGEVPILFAVEGVQVNAPGAATLRARLSPRTADTMEMTLADGTGRLVAHVDRLTVRAIAARLLRGVPRDALYELQWSPIDVVPSPTKTVIVRVEDTDSVNAAVHKALQLAQDYLAEPKQGRLVFATSKAVTTGLDDPVENVPAAAVWGLLRSAQSEHPDRFVLADVDDDPASWEALAVLGDEPQVALRKGKVLAPRLVPAKPAEQTSWVNPGAVLVTGASGALGQQVARHLVTEHGVRHLLLLSRNEPAGIGKELEELGAVVTVAACDVADRAALAAALATEPPVTTVVHAAGVLDDALLTDLTSEQIDRVLRPKVDGAKNLLELTQDAEIVLFSSAAAILGNPGQAGYAAANAALDALADQASAQGRRIRSLAWGPWAEQIGMAGRLDSAAAGRLRRLGVVPLSTDEGLALLDATAGLDSAVLLPMRVDVAALTDTVPKLLRGLAPAPERPSVSLRDTLAGLAEEARSQAVLDVVRSHVAHVLGHTEPDTVDVRQPFLDLGFTSLMAVELRNELSTAAGLRLPATLVFEFPTPMALAKHLLAELTADLAPSPPDDRLMPLLSLEPI